MSGVGIRTFCHISVHVEDMEAALAFYRDLLGLEVLFDTELEGPGLEAITGVEGARGRMVGTVVPGGTMIELVQGAQPRGAPSPIDGSRDSFIFSLSVESVDEAYDRFVAAGVTPLQKPAEIAGTRMFFVRDPDGRRIEFVEYEGGVPTAAAMHGHRAEPVR